MNLYKLECYSNVPKFLLIIYLYYFCAQESQDQEPWQIKSIDSQIHIKLHVSWYCLSPNPLLQIMRSTPLFGSFFMSYPVTLREDLTCFSTLKVPLIEYLTLFPLFFCLLLYFFLTLTILVWTTSQEMIKENRKID